MSLAVQILSDLHTEFHADRGKKLVQSLDPSGVDVLVVAGDLTAAPLLKESLTRICERYRDAQVIYILGNHEYYKSNPNQTHRILKDLSRPSDILGNRLLPNLHWLHNSTTTIQGVRFAGTPLWFRDDPLGVVYRRAMGDFHLIRDFVPWVYEENKRALDFLAEEATKADVVVTHHLPSDLCISPQFLNSPFNRFFVCDVGPRILSGEGKPALWIHGHTHESVDVHAGKTRIVANPLGYPHEANMGFDPHLVIEVG